MDSTYDILYIFFGVFILYIFFFQIFSIFYYCMVTILYLLMSKSNCGNIFDGLLAARSGFHLHNLSAKFPELTFINFHFWPIFGGFFALCRDLRPILQDLCLGFIRTIPKNFRCVSPRICAHFDGFYSLFAGIFTQYTGFKFGSSTRGLHKSLLRLAGDFCTFFASFHLLYNRHNFPYNPFF